jgi:glutamine synthetase
MEMAVHARDEQIAGMARVREAADKLEKVVADDLWPLPKYEEMLFIK